MNQSRGQSKQSYHVDSNQNIPEKSTHTSEGGTDRPIHNSSNKASGSVHKKYDIIRRDKS